MYIDNAGIIHDATLNQTSAGDNHNKYYRLQLLVSASGSYKTWTRWGRVGATGSHAILGNGSLRDALGNFGKKFKEKTGNSWQNRLDPTRADRKKAFYTFIERQYDVDSSDDEKSEDPIGNQSSKEATTSKPTEPAKSRLPKPVQRLMALIFNQQLFDDTIRILDYDAEKLPLGQLSKRTIERGFQQLKELEQLLVNPGEYGTEVFSRLQTHSNMYYTLIPHNFGFNRPPVIISEEALRKEITLLDSLSNMEIASKIMKGDGGKSDTSVHVLDRQFAGLGLQEMTPRESLN